MAVTFARNYLRIRPSVFHRGHLVALGLTDGCLPRDEIAIRAIWAYALYKTHNLLRFRPLSASEAPLDILGQFAKEGVMGHAEATSCLDGSRAAGRVRGRGGGLSESDVTQDTIDLGF